jgi:predicted dehydrogenase
MPNKPLTAIIVGAGHRAIIYASYALHYPDRMKIVGVADMNPLRREQAMKMFGFSEDICFESAEELAAQPKLADAIINGTMDHQHVSTSIPLLKKGYDMLLEKPFAVNEEEMWQLADVVKENNNKVMICHVLRYTPFYTAIRQKIIDGEIGEIINIQCNEFVSYHHMATCFVRGKWSNSEKSHSTMLLAKSCHDMDVMMWLNSEAKPVRVFSYGSNMQFTPDKCPPNAGTRCLVDCPIEPDCLYSAKKHFIYHPDRWAFYVWDSLEHIENPTIEQKIESLKTDNEYGRCVWKCDNDVVDHQSVVVEFESGATGTLNMIGGSSTGNRTVHIIGTKGEIIGDMNQSSIIVRKIDPRPGTEYSEERIDLDIKGDMVGAFGGHGGGDGRLVDDFVSFLKGEEPSISCTSIEDSIYGHLAVFKADESREKHMSMEIARK